MSNSAIQHPKGLTSGDFTEAEEPLRLFATWFEEANRSEPSLAEAMAFATVDSEGLPNTRMLLLKEFDERGFVFYSNLDSQKGQELDRNPKGAIVFHWKSLNRQVRMRGTVELVDDATADAYFATRPRLAPIGARASPQSAPPARRLAQPAVRPARKPHGFREGARRHDGEVRGWNDSTSAELGWIPADTLGYRVLARSPLSAARPRRVSPRCAGRAVEQDAALSMS